MRDEILSLLKSRPQGTVSGEELATSLKVSRAAVWKAIETLREEGYRIEGTPAKGYHLAAVPDRLLPAEILPRLQTEIFGKKIHYFAVTGSTNDEAIRRAQEGGEEGEVFLTEQQTAGRGRMGRPWESTEAKNLMISFLLKPPVPPSQAVLLTLVAGVALFDSVQTLLSNSPKTSLTLKWPNDLYLGDRKLAGILTEMESEADRVHWVVCGIGVNLNGDLSDFSPEVGGIATSLKIATGRPVNRIEAAVRLIEAFERRYLQFLDGKGPELIRFADERSYLKGKRVRWEEAGRPLQGVAAGLSSEGYLLVRTDSGETRPIFAGDVTLEKV